MSNSIFRNKTIQSKKEKKIIKNYLFIVDTPLCLAGKSSNKTI